MKLMRAGVASWDVAAITGHKNEERLKSYDDEFMERIDSNGHQTEPLICCWIPSRLKIQGSSTALYRFGLVTNESFQ